MRSFRAVGCQLFCDVVPVRNVISRGSPGRPQTNQSSEQDQQHHAGTIQNLTSPERLHPTLNISLQDSGKPKDVLDPTLDQKPPETDPTRAATPPPTAAAASAHHLPVQDHSVHQPHHKRSPPPPFPPSPHYPFSVPQPLVACSRRQACSAYTQTPDTSLKRVTVSEDQAIPPRQHPPNPTSCRMTRMKPQPQFLQAGL